jgi:GDP-L-fucose synthase
MKILLTGSTGMLGSAILRVSKNSEFEILAPKRAELDLLDQRSVFEYIKVNKPDLVLHCAAKVGGIFANIEKPIDFILQNLVMDSNLVNASLNANIDKFLYISSSCVYPRNSPQPMKIEYIGHGELEPTNKSYAMAKLSGMQLMESVNKERGYAYKSVLASNLYGPGDNYKPGDSHLLASIIRKIVEAKKQNFSEVQIFGSGKVKREFTYIDDFASWLIKTLPKLGALPEKLNVGSGLENTVDQYYETVAKVHEWHGTFSHDLSKPDGMEVKLMDSNLARTEFDWNPTTSLEEGIKKAIEYFQGDEND